MITFSLISALFGGADVCAVDESDSVIILANSNDVGSIEIANYYAEQRGIPNSNIIALPMSVEETVSVREFVDEIYNPLLNALIEKDWVHVVKADERDINGRERVFVGTHHISYLATTRGVPLRIANNTDLIEIISDQLPDRFNVNNGSVDSELALLIGPENFSMTAFVQNPFFADKSSSSVYAKRLIRVSRLDGPSVEAVKRLIDRSLQAEKEGLIGRAYFDLGGPHAKGDEWLNLAVELAEKAFFDIDSETTKQLMGETERYDGPAIYMGWYSQDAYGPWSRPSWPVPPGAIGFHLHSFSATTVRSTSSGWLGAFVNQGYCATVGNVYEPYLEFTHQPHLLLKALLEGRTFGEAAFFSIPVLSWQGVAIGDPLYRPFKVDLDTQLQNLGENPFSTYAYLRQINRLKAEETIDAAIAFAQQKFEQEPSLQLAYKLATMYADHGETKKAVNLLKAVCPIKFFAVDEVVLVKAIADFLNQKDESAVALDLYKVLIDRKGLTVDLKTELLEIGAGIALKEGDISAFSKWSSLAESLR